MLLAAVVVLFATVAADRLAQVVLAVGATGCALMAGALVLRRPSAFAVGLAGVGASYGVFVSLRTGAVDARAPAVASALFVAAEVGFWALERSPAHAELAVPVRRICGLAAAAILTALVGSLVLGVTAGVGGGVALEAAGVAAATLTVAAIAVLASRSSV